MQLAVKAFKNQNCPLTQYYYQYEKKLAINQGLLLIVLVAIAGILFSLHLVFPDVLPFLATDNYFLWFLNEYIFVMPCVLAVAAIYLGIILITRIESLSDAHVLDYIRIEDALENPLIQSYIEQVISNGRKLKKLEIELIEQTIEPVSQRIGPAYHISKAQIIYNRIYNIQQ